MVRMIVIGKKGKIEKTLRTEENESWCFFDWMLMVSMREIEMKP